MLYGIAKSLLIGECKKMTSQIIKSASTIGSSVPYTLKKALAQENACYVLITCKEPAEDGKMQVEMVYEGDACLAAYLIESAQSFIDKDA